MAEPKVQLRSANSTTLRYGLALTLLLIATGLAVLWDTFFRDSPAIRPAEPHRLSGHCRGLTPPDSPDDSRRDLQHRREALTNAFRHAHASNMEVELEYATDVLRVLVRDNGLGFGSEVPQYGRDGHWGLSGMRERAKRINARLRVMSRPSAGTEVELSVPAQVASIPKPANGTSKWWSRGRPHRKEAAGRSSSEYKQ